MASPSTEPRPDHQLITLPVSHYCEKARWGLDHSGIAFMERAHLPVLHVVAVKRAGGDRTAPVLICPGGLFADSSAILEYADRAAEQPQALYPADPETASEVRALEDHFDEDFGPHTRRWAYFHFLTAPELVRDYIATGVPAWQKRAQPLLQPGISAMIKRALRVTPEGADRSLARINEIFDEVDERLSDGRPYLTGDTFTAADLSFAAFAAPLTGPPEYGVPLPQPEQLPEPMRSAVEKFRERPAGRHVLRMYREHRRSVPVPA